jgi:protein-S-isoprenylcysteine O-methyltransferase Ste14
MPDSTVFILRFLLFALLHSLLALPRVKLKLQRLPWYRLAYNLLSLIVFGWVMMAWQSTRVLYLVPGIGNLLMQALQFLSLLAMVFCLRQTGLRSFLGLQRGESDDEALCTSGCHALVRHPLYALALLFFLLNPVMTTRWLTLAILSAVYMLLGAQLEERRLLLKHGDRYARYQRNVPFLLPNLRRHVT